MTTGQWLLMLVLIIVCLFVAAMHNWWWLFGISGFLTGTWLTMPGKEDEDENEEDS